MPGNEWPHVTGLWLICLVSSCKVVGCLQHRWLRASGFGVRKLCGGFPGLPESSFMSKILRFSCRFQSNLMGCSLGYLVGVTWGDRTHSHLTSLSLRNPFLPISFLQRFHNSLVLSLIFYFPFVWNDKVDGSYFLASKHQADHVSLQAVLRDYQHHWLEGARM